MSANKKAIKRSTWQTVQLFINIVLFQVHKKYRKIETRGNCKIFLAYAISEESQHVRRISSGVFHHTTNIVTKNKLRFKKVALRV